MLELDDTNVLPQGFWDSVCPEPNSGCWLWTGRVLSQKLPYGRPRLESGGEAVLAHRLTLSAATGIHWDTDLLALHSCDTPACVNPRHLRWGTQADNMADAAHRKRTRSRYSSRARCSRGHEYTEENTHIDARGWRQCRACGRIRAGYGVALRGRPRGEANHRSRFTEDQVKAIRARLDAGATSKAELAREYQVSWTAIYALATRRTWKHLD